MIEFQRNLPLASFTTLRIGGPAVCFASIRTEDDLLEALALARSAELPVFALGGGSNLLIPDVGFHGLVLHMLLEGGVEQNDAEVMVAAGTDWDTLVRDLCEQGISGMECLAGIPGLVGASPIQNIGAYGQDVSQTIHAVRAYDRQTGQFTTLGWAECDFAYRTSIFNTRSRDRYLITRVHFAQPRGARPNLSYPDLRKHFAHHAQPTPLEVYDAVRGIRRAKGMLLLPDGAHGVEDTRSAGSFFKNPIVGVEQLEEIAKRAGMEVQNVPRYAAAAGNVKLSAAWLLEQAGFPKGYVLGRAGISSRHSLALINRGGASYADVVRLRDQIVRVVQDRFQLTLEQEPVEPPSPS